MDNQTKEKKLNRFNVTFEVTVHHKVTLYAEVLDGTAEDLTAYVERSSQFVVEPQPLTLSSHAKEFEVVRTTGHVYDVDNVVVTEVQEEAS